MPYNALAQLRASQIKSECAAFANHQIVSCNVRYTAGATIDAAEAGIEYGVVGRHLFRFTTSQFLGTVFRVLGISVEVIRELTLGRVAQSILLRAPVRARLAGIDVRLDVPEEKRDPYLARLRDAVRLVEVYRPDVYRGLPRAFRHILIRPTGRPFYWAATRTCVLDAGSFDERYPSYVSASSIVHEYVHGRTRRFFLGMTEALLTRIEHRCMTEQIDFVKRVPESQSYVAYLENYRRQTRYDAQSRFDSHQQMMRAADVPAWALTLNAILHRPRPRRSKEADS